MQRAQDGNLKIVGAFLREAYQIECKICSNRPEAVEKETFFQGSFHLRDRLGMVLLYTEYVFIFGTCKFPAFSCTMCQV